MRRRDVLRASGLGVLAGVAGCTGLTTGGGDGPAGEETTGQRGEDGDVTVPDHAAAAGLRDQPRKGGLDGHLVVAFEDPSCPRCKAFEEQTVPKIQSELVDTGRAAYVFRGYPVVYPWGEPAAHALEATYERDESAFWDLLGFYFDNQGSGVGGGDGLTEDNVVDRTRQFLDDHTGVDGDAVAEDTTNETYAGAVQADLDAGEEAGAGRSTPTIFLFADGEYRTTLSGSASYDAIATALGE